MNWIIFLIGLVTVIWGLAVLLRPTVIYSMLNFFSKGKKNVNILGTLRIILGVLLLLFARETKFYFFVIIFGIIVFTAGLLTLCLPQEKIMLFLSFWKKKPSYIFRILSLVSITVGFGLIYSAL